jgi:hypothetical protein
LLTPTRRWKRRAIVNRPSGTVVGLRNLGHDGLVDPERFRCWLRLSHPSQRARRMGHPFCPSCTRDQEPGPPRQNFQGFLRVSGKLLGRSVPDGLYAIKADGTSMNRADVNGKRIEDGDYVIVDRQRRDPRNNQIVVAIVDNKATIKRFIDDRQNGQIVLQADSSFDYAPIYLHPDDDFAISGTVVDVVKRPAQT